MRRSAFAKLPPLILESQEGEREVPDYPAIAKAYAEAAASGEINVCKWIKLSAQRYLRMLQMAESDDCVFTFSPEHVIDYCEFQEKLKHVESGLWEITQVNADGSLNPQIILEPWQIWIEAAVQGFRRRATGERLVTTVLELIPRKSAKSLKVAGAALFDLCCSGQLSPQIPIAASTANQANRVFSPISKFVANDPELVEQYKIKVTLDRITTSECGEYDGIFKLSSIGERQDGFNPSLAIFEEGHAGAAGVYKVVDSAFGARPNALKRMITTAGYRPEGPAWELVQEAKLILEGKGGNEDYSFFAAIYTLDEEDYQDPDTKAIDWERLFTDDSLLEKSNPMFGVSLDPIKILDDRRKARRRPDLRAEFARTRFNIWTGSGSALIDIAAWMACKRNITPADFFGFKCWIGVDLAQVLDMCAVALIFELPDDVIAAFVKYFLPEASPTALDEDMADQLSAWAEEGWLDLTPGPLADHDRVREEIETYCDVFRPEVIACDPLQAHNTVKHLWDGSRPVMVYPNSAKTMTGPTDDIIGRIAAQKIWHDGNPVLAWNAANVHGERKGNGSILPRKETANSKRKIDGFVAICMANGCRMQPAEAKQPDGSSVIDPFLLRGGTMLGYEEASHGQ